MSQFKWTNEQTEYIGQFVFLCVYVMFAYVLGIDIPILKIKNKIVSSSILAFE